MIDAIFFTDIILNFRTTYIDERTGAEIRNLKRISKHYMANAFTIDFVSSEKLCSILNQPLLKYLVR